MIQPMEIILIERGGRQHSLTLPDIEPVSSDWLLELTKRFFTNNTTGGYEIPPEERTNEIR